MRISIIFCQGVSVMLIQFFFSTSSVFSQYLLSALGNVPCPIVYGAIVDSACLMWDKVCGKAGACRLYDSTTFRYFFHGKLKI